MSLRSKARTWSTARARVVVVAAYALALATAFAVGAPLAATGAHPLLVAFAADLAATAVIFAGSVALGNASLYDPYWSVAPLPIVLWWALGPGADGDALGARQLLVITAVSLWSLRLTANWTRGWRGFHHEDWRYEDLRESSGRAWPLVNFSGIHLFPTLMVFAGLIPLYPALVTGDQPFGVADLLAFGVAAGGVALELAADEQLRGFVRSGQARGATLQRGVWAHSRHPNYLGENLFWWGLGFFALAADPSWWWALAGPVAMTAMFLLASIPMIERRMLERRPDYADYQSRVPMLLPRPWAGPRG